MTYQVLARKWRPQDFSSIVGQEPIITALQNGLKDGRIAQAYLFSGIRGVGKTTAARVLAKALNCEKSTTDGGSSGDPCNECLTCTEITAGTDMDVLEVDAATYSKVEQIRELTESLRYGPARDRFKVVVLDEVHRLSRQAFDALLKIVEEPPSHLVFIFATTEIDAVPATILSRCQEFQFRRVPSPILAQHLRRLSDAEEITVSDAALRLIARAGEGSVRDSVALLDQLATFGNYSIHDRDASNLLGGLDAAIFLQILKAILEGNPSAVAEIIQEVEANGWDPHNVFGQFLIYTRDALHLAIGGEPENIDLPLEEAEALATLVKPQSYEALLRLNDHLLASEPIVRRSEFALLALELAWLRAAELPKLTRIEDLIAGSASAIDPPKDPTRSPSPSTNVSRGSGRKQPKLSSRPSQTPRSPVPASSTNPSDGPPPLSNSSRDSASSSPDRIEAFRDLLSSRRQPLAALVESADLTLEEGQLLVQPPAGDSLLSSALKRKNNETLFTELTRQIWGEQTTWALREAPPPSKTQGSIRKSQREEAKAASQDPTVRTVLDVFGGNIQSVQHYEKRDTAHERE